MYINGILWVLLASLIIYILYAIRGPAIWDRLLAMSVISTKIIIIIIFFATINDVSYLLDFAIIYALFGFIGTIFIALFLSERSSRKKE
ncbi:MAG: monovalent cation/H+ antiporter complex subunit F [Firmicutes bacterium]|nr:monovalent cation/H+ antiporter complex subunit F [Bacillota bacterium]